MLAAQHGHLEVVKYLVQEAGADKDKECKVSTVRPSLLRYYCSLPRLVSWRCVCMVTAMNSGGTQR
jgi:hypothetical protein